MKTQDGNYITIQARICDTVTGTILRKQIPMEKFRRSCQDLTMADEPPDQDRRTTIDILIGSDFYEDVMKPEKIKVGSGMYLVNSSFGWMFSGRTSETCDEEEECVMVAEDNCDG